MRSVNELHDHPGSNDQRSERGARSARAISGGLLLILSTISVALATACFSPAQPDVSFTCEPSNAQDDRECPRDYRCEADGCCHKIGSNVDASFGDCFLGLDGGSGTDSTTGADDSTTDGTGTDTGTT